MLFSLCLQLLDLTIERDRPRFHVKIADFGLARMVGPTSSIAVSKVRRDAPARPLQLPEHTSRNPRCGAHRQQPCFMTSMCAPDRKAAETYALAATAGTL
jgi:hypothetical protein